jgi:hypothetical protein
MCVLLFVTETKNGLSALALFLVVAEKGASADGDKTAPVDFRIATTGDKF